jgi:uncharacterized protein YyaL (SSP411 family)
VFVSIGYAACHWCHVMAHESFEDPAIAALMNELYVNVKVDREERPDVDTIYMNAIQVLGEGGGWPLSAFCLPDGRPYFLGTYFPVEDRYNRPSFSKVLRAMAQAYREEREKVMENVEGLVEGLGQVDRHYRGAPRRRRRGGVAAGHRRSADRRPLRRRARRPVRARRSSRRARPTSCSRGWRGSASVSRPRTRSCRGPTRWRPAASTIISAAGFARYSVDEHWLVPHFEKMLYDQGQLLGIYADAYAITSEPRHARVIEAMVGYLGRELSDPAGGLWASQDADSEGEEGKYYVWTPAQVREALGFVDALQLCKAYGVTSAGNFEHGASVLARVTPPGARSDEAHLDALRARLLAARQARVAPATDDKVLAGWNGLAVTGLVRAWNATGHEPALALARRVGDFLLAHMIQGDRLARVWKAGATKLDGTLEDYAFVAAALFELAEATFDARYWHAGAALVGAIRARFFEDTDGGVFYLTSSDDAEPRIHRPESHHDGAMPSGAAVAVEALIRVGYVADDASALTLAERYLERRLSSGALGPLGAARLLSALDLFLHAQCVVISEGRGADDLRAAARAAYAPARILIGPWAAPSVIDGKGSDGARARAYVCRGPVCSLPVTDGGELTALLASRLREPRVSRVAVSAVAHG